jgi:hypothetical protein
VPNNRLWRDCRSHGSNLLLLAKQELLQPQSCCTSCATVKLAVYQQNRRIVCFYSNTVQTFCLKVGRIYDRTRLSSPPMRVGCTQYTTRLIRISCLRNRESRAHVGVRQFEPLLNGQNSAGLVRCLLDAVDASIGA